MINKIYTEEIFKFFTSDINAYISLTAGKGDVLMFKTEVPLHIPAVIQSF